MSLEQKARLEVLSAIKCVNSVSELNELRDVIARYFADKAQKAIDSLWDEGAIDDSTIEAWGNEHMRTPYQYAKNRS